MYESPLNKICSDIQSQMIKQDEENMMLCINQSVGYSVDKEELIKALNYDREQYEKGYKDAMSVIEDIKAEIHSAYSRYYATKWEGGIELCERIIDKHLADMRGKSCNTCKNNDDELSGECYECIKGIFDHYEPQESEE